jgi:hypothetical protein
MPRRVGSDGTGVLTFTGNPENALVMKREGGRKRMIVKDERG